MKIEYIANQVRETVKKYDERNFGGNTYEYAMMLCLDAVVKM